MTAKIYTSILHNAIAGTIQDTVHVGGDGINIIDGMTYNLWLPDSVGGVSARTSYDAGNLFIVDYFAFDNHNLKDIYFFYIRLIGSNDPNFTSYHDFGKIWKADIVSGANIKEFYNTTNYRYYSLEIWSDIAFTDDPIIGVFYTGKTLALPEGIQPSYTPPRYGITSNISNNNSGLNHFIGRSVKRSNYEFIVKNQYLQPSWFTDNWNDLYNYIEKKPFFYLWNDSYTDAGIFGWTVKKIRAPKYNDSCFMSFSIKCEGFRQ